MTSEQLTFLYDPGWNLTNRAVNGAGSTYTVDDRNQLLTEPGLTDVYDANGNLSQRLSSGYVAYTSLIGDHRGVVGSERQ